MILMCARVQNHEQMLVPCLLSGPAGLQIHSPFPSTAGCFLGSVWPVDGSDEIERTRDNPGHVPLGQRGFSSFLFSPRIHGRTHVCMREGERAPSTGSRHATVPSLQWWVFSSSRRWGKPMQLILGSRKKAALHPRVWLGRLLRSSPVLRGMVCFLCCGGALY